LSPQSAKADPVSEIRKAKIRILIIELNAIQEPENQLQFAKAPSKSNDSLARADGGRGAPLKASV
jgi:hypothetical protein